MFNLYLPFFSFIIAEEFWLLIFLPSDSTCFLLYGLETALSLFYKCIYLGLLK